jgi:transcriptional regulator with XRE-family HTH domain
MVATFANMSTAKALEGLRNTMEKHQLTQRDVAELCCVSIKTVESWLADPSSANHRKMPPRHMLGFQHAIHGFLAKRKTAEHSAKKRKK